VKARPPTYIIVYGYLGPICDRRFWSGRRWVQDVDGVQTYSEVEARDAFAAVCRPAQFNPNTYLIQDFGTAGERIALECRGEVPLTSMPLSSEVSP
jgi:hypothetical protein